ncbi:MAG: hypothetical protein QM726_16630 [Chitinophagaceae bacterium]
MPLVRFPYINEENEIYDYESFWEWFEEHHSWFHYMLQKNRTPDGEFYTIFRSRLDKVNKELSFAMGFLDDGTIELVFVVQSLIKNIVFAEELAAAAPALPGWKFTGLMQEVAPHKLVNRDDASFTLNDVAFISTEHPDLPDLIDITLIFKKRQKDEETLRTEFACYNFVMQLIGELEMLTMIDQMNIREYKAGDPDLIPITKLKDFLHWREKEFVEKYKDVKRDDNKDAEDKHAVMDVAPVDGGLPIKMNIPNRYLLCREETVPYPWISSVHIKFEGSALDGLADYETSEKIKTFELELSVAVEMYAKGQLELFSTTSNGNYTIIFAGNEFREISKVIEETIAMYAEGLAITYIIVKDKYWNSINIVRKACMNNGGTFTA